LLQRSRGRKIPDGFDFKGIQVDALFGDKKPKNFSRFNAEDTFMWIKANMIVPTAKKYFTKVFLMVLLLC